VLAVARKDADFFDLVAKLQQAENSVLAWLRDSILANIFYSG